MKKRKRTLETEIDFNPLFFFYLGFFFTNHRAEVEGGGHFINSLLPLSPASQTL